MPMNVAILIFDGVEVLDFAGPYEVFSRTRTVPGTESRRSEEHAPFRVFTVAPQGGTIRATGGLQVTADYSVADFQGDKGPTEGPAKGSGIDLLVVPGGFGTRPLLEDPSVLDWLRLQAGQVQQLTSVCTGALLLAKAGLLSDQRATTHWASLDLLGQVDPSIRVERVARVVEDRVVTSAGVAAGIDMAFTMVARLCGEEVARETAVYIEYPWEGLRG
jgi:transcriptional regulator GlxA family with amidase domain